MEASQDIVWGVSLGMVAFMLLAGSIVFFSMRYQKKILEKQKELYKKEGEYKILLLKNTIDATEQERRRIAGDLHDEIGSYLSTIRMMLGNIKNQAGDLQGLEKLSLESKALLDNTISSVRTISHHLLPPGLEKFGLINTLEDLCISINKSQSINAELWVQPSFPELSKPTELALYRMAQELTTNSLRHGKALSVSLNLSYDDNLIFFVINDDGTGCDEMVIKDKKGLGLLNIESRVLALNGKCTFTTSLRKGFKATIEIPV